MRRVAWAGLIGTALLLSLAGVAAAKEGAEASLDAPIPPGAEPGSEIEVGWSAGWPDGTGGLDPIIGSPVFIRLTSVDGSERIEASGTERPSGSGHYVATITVPRGGVGLVEIGLRGESCVEGTCTRSDLLFELPENQRMPQTVAALRVVPLATAADPAAGRSVAATVATRDPASNVPAAVAIIAVGALLVVVALSLARRTRTVEPSRG